MEQVKQLLVDTIETEVKGLNQLSMGSEERSAAVDEICKLSRIVMDTEKNEVEAEDKAERRTIDRDTMKLDAIDKEKTAREANRQFDETQKNERNKLITETAVAAGGILVTVVCFGIGLNFEKTATILSPMVRNLVPKTWLIKK